MIVVRKVNVQYQSTKKSYSDECARSSPEQEMALNDLLYGSKILFKKMKNI